MSKVRSHSSRVVLRKLPPPPMPALLNTRFTWSVPCSLRTSSAKRCTSASDATSARWVVMRVPTGASFSARRAVSSRLSRLMSHAATWQPSAASWITSSRPMPVPPPVTTASFPSNDCIACPLERRHPLCGATYRRTRAPHQAVRRLGSRPGVPISLAAVSTPPTARPAPEVALVTGGAGFVGRHLIERLLEDFADTQVISVDNYFTGSVDNHVDSDRVQYITASSLDINRIW